MKNLYAVLVLVFCSFVSNAQIVNIPSEGLEYVLLNGNCADTNEDGIIDGDVDTNNDGEIQVSEALSVNYLEISNWNLDSFEGINYFTNLKTLICANNDFTTLNLTNLINLETLDCNYASYLTSLNISGLVNLKTLNCSDSRLTSLDVSLLTSLESLICSGNRSLNSLTVNGANNLKTIDCSYNKLTSLNLTNLTNLKTLNCESQYIATPFLLEMTGLNSLLSLNCNSNNLSTLYLAEFPTLTQLNCYNNFLLSLDVSNLINLKNLDCSVNLLNSLEVSNLTSLENLNLYSNNISTLDISNLTNLTNLNCNVNNLSTLNISNQLNMKYLYCGANNITELNITNLSNLEELVCSNNQLTILDVSNLNSLKKLYCNDNNLNTLSLVNASNLGILVCSNNNLSSLDIANFTNLGGLSCAGNQLSTLDFTNLHKLLTVNLSNNLFTTLDFSVMQPDIPLVQDIYYGMTYIIDNCPNLTYLNIKTGIRFAQELSNHHIVFSIYNCPNLIYMCVNEQYSGWEIPNIQINSYCSFNPGGTYNTITGTFSLDNDNNGCDANDYHFSDSKIKIDDSTLTGATYTNTSGKYSFFTQAGNFTITPEFENPYFTVSPTSATITFADSNNNTQTQNFCVTPNGVHNDVEVSVLPVQQPRPGFDATYQMVYKNKGNQVLSGNVNLAFNDAVLDFITSNPALAAQSLNMLSWSYSNLLPFESRTIYFTLNVNSPQEIPAVNNGDVLSFSASIDPIAGDETVNDNTFVLAQTVLGSYDPNDKTCLEGNTIVPERIGEYLHYLIRFQNSGTAAAENIVVKDIIDTTKFDITSLQLTAASHDYKTKITGNKVEFIFENIQLPAEIDNEAASHGFVAFKIKTKNNLSAGNSVSNKADIYFDYNFPITTNEATTTFATLGVNQVENKSVAVFPNPVNDVLTITSKGNLTSIQLLDVQGRILATYLENEEKATINLSDKASGVYFVKIFTENGVKLEKIVKK